MKCAKTYMSPAPLLEFFWQRCFQPLIKEIPAHYQGHRAVCALLSSRLARCMVPPSAIIIRSRWVMRWKCEIDWRRATLQLCWWHFSEFHAGHILATRTTGKYILPLHTNFYPVGPGKPSTECCSVLQMTTDSSVWVSKSNWVCIVCTGVLNWTINCWACQLFFREDYTISAKVDLLNWPFQCVHTTHAFYQWKFNKRKYRLYIYTFKNSLLSITDKLVL